MMINNKESLQYVSSFEYQNHQQERLEFREKVLYKSKNLW